MHDFNVVIFSNGSCRFIYKERIKYLQNLKAHVFIFRSNLKIKQ